MAWLGTDPTDLNQLLGCSMRISLMNYTIMEMLDIGETTTFGHPELTQVNVKPVQGKCILVSGHDLHDLEKKRQQKEFANFPGAIVMTSNCLLNPDVG